MIAAKNVKYAVSMLYTHLNPQKIMLAKSTFYAPLKAALLRDLIYQKSSFSNQ